MLNPAYVFPQNIVFPTELQSRRAPKLVFPKELLGSRDKERVFLRFGAASGAILRPF